MVNLRIMGAVNRNLKIFLIVICPGLLCAFFAQFIAKDPISRNIHIRSFRYGKDPAVIRCNRGDTLHLTFSSDDTGHSFFLEEFDTDAKVSPSKEEVEIFSPADPSRPPVIARELTLITRHKGIRNYLVSKSNYRCHVWCGPMHAFEQGKLVIFPNTLLMFGVGCTAGIVFLWVMAGTGKISFNNSNHRRKDLLNGSQYVRKMVVSRWPQVIVTILAMVMIYLVLMTTLFGTKVSGRNLGVLLMWAVWLFLLVVILTPLGGRSWCTICPLPLLGDRLQRGSFITPRAGRSGEYNNEFSGLFRKWPSKLGNNWLKLFIFLSLATFSTTLVASPKVSGLAVLGLVIVPAAMSLVWELRSFCRFVCPVSVFITPFAEMSPVALRCRSEEVCRNCKPHYCRTGNNKGWACPYGIDAGQLDHNADCGLCFECLRSCTFNNVTVFSKPFAGGRIMRDLSESWLAMAIFTTAVIYSVLYLGPWPQVRDFVNILDKDNWRLFGGFTAIFWFMVLAGVPLVIYTISYIGNISGGRQAGARQMFFANTASMLPLGLMLWISFVIPMLFVNVTFIGQSLSDPFGWGWDFFGTANIPWHQFMPEYIPWFQASLVLAGLYLSLRNSLEMTGEIIPEEKKRFKAAIPFGLLLVGVSVMMIVFFTN
jgi:hypothetical protein